MQLRLMREIFSDRSTIGQLYVGDNPECYTLEDRVREGKKVAGSTAIPEGRYRIVITMSTRFQRLLPLLLDVPGFSGVRIHPGNSYADTEGCILVGHTFATDWIGDSRLAFTALFGKLQAAVAEGEVWIEILRGGGLQPTDNSSDQSAEGGS